MFVSNPVNLKGVLGRSWPDFPTRSRSGSWFDDFGRLVINPDGIPDTWLISEAPDDYNIGSNNGRALTFVKKSATGAAVYAGISCEYEMTKWNFLPNIFNGVSAVSFWFRGITAVLNSGRFRIGLTQPHSSMLARKLPSIELEAVNTGSETFELTARLAYQDGTMQENFLGETRNDSILDVNFWIDQYEVDFIVKGGLPNPDIRTVIKPNQKIVTGLSPFAQVYMATYEDELDIEGISAEWE